MVDNKVVIITGSARGIGFEIGKHFAADGAKVALSDINEEGVKEAAESLKKLGYESIGVKADVTSEEDLQNLVNATKEKYGRIDILINNAGLQHVAPIEEFPTVKFELMIKIMLTAPFIHYKKSIPYYERARLGPHYQRCFY